MRFIIVARLVTRWSWWCVFVHYLFTVGAAGRQAWLLILTHHFRGEGERHVWPLIGHSHSIPASDWSPPRGEHETSFPWMIFKAGLAASWWLGVILLTMFRAQRRVTFWFRIIYWFPGLHLTFDVRSPVSVFYAKCVMTFKLLNADQEGGLY